MRGDAFIPIAWAMSSMLMLAVGYVIGWRWG